MCAVAVAIDRFSAFGATAQPANSSVKNATTVRLTAPPLSILFFMNPFISLIRPAQHRVYSTPSDKKGLMPAAVVLLVLIAAVAGAAVHL